MIEPVYAEAGDALTARPGTDYISEDLLPHIS
jgi:hypothetical protein